MRAAWMRDESRERSATRQASPASMASIWVRSNGMISASPAGMSEESVGEVSMLVTVGSGQLGGPGPAPENTKPRAMGPGYPRCLGSDGNGYRGPVPIEKSSRRLHEAGLYQRHRRAGSEQEKMSVPVVRLFGYEQQPDGDPDGVRGL